ncbi:unnamed protein product [Amoebophrya sp. A120]|nr:unnamed protein product [Amoebophrya sp. A120]|eukprot:GSA120T00007624001.1
MGHLLEAGVGVLLQGPRRRLVVLLGSVLTPLGNFYNCGFADAAAAGTGGNGMIQKLKQTGLNLLTNWDPRYGFPWGDKWKFHCPKPTFSTGSGLPAKFGVHATCVLKIPVQEVPCKTVFEEITLRGSERSLWVDPHNMGTYAITYTDPARKGRTAPDDDLFKGSIVEVDRQTKLRDPKTNQPYTDKIILRLLEVTETGKTRPTCNVYACSMSQVKSVRDGSTNYCNIKNLICGHKSENNREKNCPVMQYSFGDLGWTKSLDEGGLDFGSCTQHDDKECKSGEYLELEPEENPVRQLEVYDDAKQVPARKDRRTRRDSTSSSSALEVFDDGSSQAPDDEETNTTISMSSMGAPNAFTGTEKGEFLDEQ